LEKNLKVANVDETQKLKFIF